MVFDELNKKVADHVSLLFTQHADERLLYHNLTHTLEVTQRVIEIAKYYTPVEEIMFILKTAAWFHDTGYLFVGGKDHEEEGVYRMKEFLTGLKVFPPVMDTISRCIMATKRSGEPVTQLERIVCDADTYHFGTLLFRETDLLVKKELEAFTGTTFTHWTNDSIALLTNHRFYTYYCQQKLSAGKKENIEWLRSLL
jgi:predicted metal-dependent HD superfamily phosphohydrolase